MMNSAESKNLEKALFAGGCFWCMEAPFAKLTGVVSVVSGFTGGKEANPTYKEVSAGKTGHAEAIEVTYDPAQVSYAELLDVFWRNVDPTNADGQFNDKGKQYRTAIFYNGEEQKRLAEAAKDRLEREDVFGKPIVTQISPAGPFYKADEYHQDYHRKCPIPYKFYRFMSGRDRYLKKTWGQGGNKH
jgi:methionine-S-sulfoxide reductase